MMKYHNITTVFLFLILAAIGCSHGSSPTAPDTA